MTKKITGTKTPAEQKTAIAKAVAKGKGPKAGSAMANQSVKLSADDKAQIKDEAASRKPSKLKANPDTIKEVKGTSNGNHIAISTGFGNETITVHTTKLVGELKKLAVVGGSMRAVKAFIKTHKPEAKLATGLDGRNAPQSAQAAAESRTKPEGKASPSPANTSAGKNTKTATGTKTAPVAKASAGAKLSQKGDDRAYVATDKEDTSRDGTFRRYMISTIRAHKTVGAAKAAHAKSGQFSKDKLNHNWAAQNGFIKFV